MVTDWILVRRAAHELERELRGGRVTDAGLLDDGRFGVRIGGRGGRPETVLAIDIFGSPPLVTLEQTELSIGAAPGWARSLAVTLRGLRLGEVRSRPGDRVLVLDFGTTSRFGVTTGVKLVAELIPRFGNLLLLRDGAVIAAAKQFSPAENETRSVGVGGPYRPPPLPDGGPRAPKLIAAAQLADATAAADGDGPVYAYREAGKLVAAHVVPLAAYAGLACSTEPALLPLFAEARATSAGRRASDAGERRRAALRARIEKRLRDVADEIEAVGARRDDAAGRDQLRAAGDALYTYGNEIPAAATSFRTPGETPLDIALDPELDAKGNAASYFARYRKATAALPHFERRIAALQAKRASLEELAFENERGDATTLAEVGAELDRIDGRRAPPGQASPTRATRAPLRIERPSGARIFVGRSPRENVELTFRIARPDDLWFHARGIPGSHVVLQPPPGGEPDPADLDCAADFAALHSRARNAPRVEVDYTERKYVRKQRDAAPGMVWYTNARSRVGRPENVASG
ncbi:MAG TPA: NFACT RNA binding domain-containing protein [Candidatus Lustribacter sp.]|nr:NFACT RNA binding domain-containing protein [Candidatus Lustribacter sp.]